MTAKSDAVTRFSLDEVKARQFLARSLRRYAADSVGPHESWCLPPGWNLDGIDAGETGNVEDLVYQAIHEAGVISCPGEADLDLLIDASAGVDWMYQWRIRFGASAGFARMQPVPGRLPQPGPAGQHYQGQRRPDRAGNPARGRGRRQRPAP